MNTFLEFLSDDYKNLKYMNLWKKIPDAVRLCREMKHNPIQSQIDATTHKVVCDQCKYYYRIDSSY